MGFENTNHVLYLVFLNLNTSPVLIHFLQCILTAYQFKLCVDGCILAGFGRVIPASPALLKSLGKILLIYFRKCVGDQV
jgi:hypothetical protein